MYNYYNDQEKNQNDYAIQFHDVGGVGHNITSFKIVLALVNEDRFETKVFVSFSENVPATPRHTSNVFVMPKATRYEFIAYFGL